MIGLHPVEPTEAKTYFANFMKAYSDTHKVRSDAEVRRRRALIIFNNRKVAEPIEGLSARMALVSQWADPEEIRTDFVDVPLAKTAKRHFDVVNTAEKLKGQPVLAFSGVTTEELKDEAFTFPTTGFAVSLGNLEGGVSFSHQVPSESWKMAMGLPQAASILRFRLGLETDGVTIISFDAAGNPETQSQRDSAIPFYAGRVCLDPDRDRYHSIRQVTPEEDIVFGEQHVSDMLNLLNRRSMEAAPSVSL